MLYLLCMSEHTTQLLDVSLLHPNPFQPRNRFQAYEIEEMADSIRKIGILEPLVIAQTPAGYQIIAGERRWRGAKEAGLTQVPVVIRKVKTKEMLELALVENVQRIDLNAMERAKAFRQLQREFNLTPTEIADRVSKSLPYVSNTLKLLTLPDAIKDGLMSGDITEGHARALAGIPDTKAAIGFYKQILAEGASVRDVEEWARKWKDDHDVHPYQYPKPKLKVTQIDDPAVQQWKNSFAILIKEGTQVEPQLKLMRSSVSTKIVITLKGTHDQTQKALENLMKLGS